MTDRELAKVYLTAWARCHLCDHDETHEIELDERLLKAVERACALAREEGRKEHGGII